MMLHCKLHSIRIVYRYINLSVVITGHQAGVEAPARTTMPNVGAADRGRHWAQRQRRLEDRT